MRPTIYIQTEVIEIDTKMVLVVHVQEGKDKPYKNLAGNIWVKQGADKRRVTDNAEILSLFQQSGTYHPDEAGVNGSSYKDIDTLALDRFFENVYHKPISEFDIPQEQVLQSLHIMDEQGRLTPINLNPFSGLRFTTSWQMAAVTVESRPPERPNTIVFKPLSDR